MPAVRGKNFNEALLKGLSADLPDIVLVKRAPPPKTSQSKVKVTVVKAGLASTRSFGLLCVLVCYTSGGCRSFFDAIRAGGIPSALLEAALPVDSTRIDKTR